MTDKIRKEHYLSLFPFLLGGIYFAYIFIKIPAVSDRWWSEFVYDMGDSWRIVLSQVYCGARILLYII